MQVLFAGGDSGNRTHDLLNAIQALYQLSYIPICFFGRCEEQTCAELLPRRFSAFLPSRLLAFDGADGAAFFAGAAVNADIGIDLILSIALRNRVYGASIRASAAGDAIFRNFMCHDLLPPNNFFSTCKSKPLRFCRFYYNINFYIRKDLARGYFQIFSTFFC